MRIPTMRTLLLLALLPLSAALAQPKLEATPEVFDLGRRQPSETGYEFTFALRNGGTEPLIIEKVRPFCGCTTVAPAKQELLPGESVELHGTLKTQGFEGPVTKSVMVESNDPERPRRVLSITAHLPFKQTGLRYNPYFDPFYAREFNGRFRTFVWLENCDATGVVHVTKVEAPEGWTMVTPLPAEVKAEAKVNLQFERPSDDGSNFTDARFKIFTDHPKFPVMAGRMAYDKTMFKTVQSALVTPLPPGLRLLPSYPDNQFPAYLSQGKLRVFVLIENGDTETPVTVEKVDLPEDWQLSVQLPMEVKGQGKTTLQFQRSADGVTEVPSLPFTIHVKDAKTPTLEGKIKYRKPGLATVPAPIAAPAAAVPPPQKQ